MGSLSNAKWNLNMYASKNISVRLFKVLSINCRNIYHINGNVDIGLLLVL